MSGLQNIAKHYGVIEETTSDDTASENTADILSYIAALHNQVRLAEAFAPTLRKAIEDVAEAGEAAHLAVIDARLREEKDEAVWMALSTQIHDVMTQINMTILQAVKDNGCEVLMRTVTVRNGDESECLRDWVLSTKEQLVGLAYMVARRGHMCKIASEPEADADASESETETEATEEPPPREEGEPE